MQIKKAKQILQKISKKFSHKIQFHLMWQNSCSSYFTLYEKKTTMIKLKNKIVVFALIQC